MLTETQKQQIKRLRECGHSFADISNTLDLSVGTVKSYCSRNNIFSPTSYENKDLCLNCHKPIYQIKGVKKKKFCSDKCRVNWWNNHKGLVNRRSSAIYKITCACCGNTFESYGNKHRKYCSTVCYFNHRFRTINTTNRTTISA